ncbi:MAG: branched-chain amino acid ABC transporter ATP-binding protein/permease, partial [Burkholderiales bacterium]|nr:branched-chain amino acid ABC transporter ATP-binding protein/permease [Burkholderiales bacterium]
MKSGVNKGILLLLAIVMAVPVLPVPEFWITLANYIGMYAIVALGLVLLTGVGGLTSFGQAAFVGLGAYSTAYLSTALGYSPWLGLLVGLGITIVAALAIGMITMRLSGHYLPLGTIAWGLSLYFLFGNLEFLGKYDGINGIPPISLFAFEFESSRRMYVLIWVILLLAILAVQNLLQSRPGRAIRALKGGGVMAEAMGVNTARMKVIIFVIAAMLASISGWLYAHLQRAVNPTPFGLNAGIEYLFMAVVGGAGHVWGALLGSALLTLLKDKLQTILPVLLGANGNFEVIVFGVLLVLLLQRARDGVWPYFARMMAWLFGKWMPKEKGVQIQPGAAALPVRQKPVANTVILEVDNARKQFGGLVAVNDMQFQVSAGQIVGLIGPNGAGKSTMFNLVTGVLPLTSGAIRFYRNGQLQTIDNLPSREIVKLGIGRTFQHVRLLASMSVLENVAIGAHLRSKGGDVGEVLASIFRRDRKIENALLNEARIQLERVGLGHLMHEEAGSLALGQQRILEIARALCC